MALYGPLWAAERPALSEGRSRGLRPPVGRTAVFPAPKMPSRSVQPHSDRPAVSCSHRIGGLPVPHPLDPPEADALPRRFRTLTPAQLDLAREITRRADKLWQDAGGELSLAEAVTLAAVQLGHYPDQAAS